MIGHNCGFFHAACSSKGVRVLRGVELGEEAVDVARLVRARVRDVQVDAVLMHCWQCRLRVNALSVTPAR